MNLKNIEEYRCSQKIQLNRRIHIKDTKIHMRKQNRIKDRRVEIKEADYW